jgi:transcriptional regulator with XRE-family HTH domain
MNQIQDTLAKNLKKARKRAGFTQAGLADRLGVSQPTYQGWEQAKHQPKLEYIAEIAEICEVRMSWLLGERLGRPVGAGACKPFHFLARDIVNTGGNQE